MTILEFSGVQIQKIEHASIWQSCLLVRVPSTKHWALIFFIIKIKTIFRISYRKHAVVLWVWIVMGNILMKISFLSKNIFYRNLLNESLLKTLQETTEKVIPPLSSDFHKIRLNMIPYRACNRLKKKDSYLQRIKLLLVSSNLSWKTEAISIPPTPASVSVKRNCMKLVEI